MLSITCLKPGALELTARPRPVRAPDELLVRISRVGMCGTDYHILQGTQPYLTYPRVMGHELAGIVEEADEAGSFAPGTLVAIMPYLFCGSCVACRRGKTNCCRNIQVLGVHTDGGLAQYLAIDPRFVLDASGLTPDQAAMVEFLAIGRHAVARAAIEPEQKVLVVGTGPIGMAVALFARDAGAIVTVLDGNAARAAFCRDSLGAAHAVTLTESVAERLEEITSGNFFDAVFDATGNSKAMESGFAYVAHGGCYVLVSIVSADIRFNDPEFHKRETTLLGSRNATCADFEAVIAAIRAGRIPTNAMHTHSAALADVPDAMPRWMQPESGVIKAIVEV